MLTMKVVFLQNFVLPCGWTLCILEVFLPEQRLVVRPEGELSTD